MMKAVKITAFFAISKTVAGSQSGSHTAFNFHTLSSPTRTTKSNPVYHYAWPFDKVQALNSPGNSSPFPKITRNKSDPGPLLTTYRKANSESDWRREAALKFKNLSEFRQLNEGSGGQSPFREVVRGVTSPQSQQINVQNQNFPVAIDTRSPKGSFTRPNSLTFNHNDASSTVTSLSPRAYPVSESNSDSAATRRTTSTSRYDPNQVQDQFTASHVADRSSRSDYHSFSQMNMHPSNWIDVTEFYAPDINHMRNHHNSSVTSNDNFDFGNFKVVFYNANQNYYWLGLENMLYSYHPWYLQFRNMWVPASTFSDIAEEYTNSSSSNFSNAIEEEYMNMISHSHGVNNKAKFQSVNSRENGLNIILCKCTRSGNYGNFLKGFLYHPDQLWYGGYYKEKCVQDYYPEYFGQSQSQRPSSRTHGRAQERNHGTSSPLLGQRHNTHNIPRLNLNFDSNRTQRLSPRSIETASTPKVSPRDSDRSQRLTSPRSNATPMANLEERALHSPQHLPSPKAAANARSDSPHGRSLGDSYRSLRLTGRSGPGSANTPLNPGQPVLNSPQNRSGPGPRAAAYAESPRPPKYFDRFQRLTSPRLSENASPNSQSLVSPKSNKSSFKEPSLLLPGVERRNLNSNSSNTSTVIASPGYESEADLENYTASVGSRSHITASPGYESEADLENHTASFGSQPSRIHTNRSSHLSPVGLMQDVNDGTSLFKNSNVEESSSYNKNFIKRESDAYSDDDMDKLKFDQESLIATDASTRSGASDLYLGTKSPYLSTDYSSSIASPAVDLPNDSVSPKSRASSPPTEDQHITTQSPTTGRTPHTSVASEPILNSTSRTSSPKVDQRIINSPNRAQRAPLAIENILSPTDRTSSPKVDQRIINSPNRAQRAPLAIENILSPTDRKSSPKVVQRIINSPIRAQRAPLAIENTLSPTDRTSSPKVDQRIINSPNRAQRVPLAIENILSPTDRTSSPKVNQRIINSPNRAQRAPLAIENILSPTDRKSSPKVDQRIINSHNRAQRAPLAIENILSPTDITSSPKVDQRIINRPNRAQLAPLAIENILSPTDRTSSPKVGQRIVNRPNRAQRAPLAIENILSPTDRTSSPKVGQRIVNRPNRAQRAPLAIENILNPTDRTSSPKVDQRFTTQQLAAVSPQGPPTGLDYGDDVAIIDAPKQKGFFQNFLGICFMSRK